LRSLEPARGYPYTTLAMGCSDRHRRELRSDKCPAIYKLAVRSSSATVRTTCPSVETSAFFYDVSVCFIQLPQPTFISAPNELFLSTTSSNTLSLPQCKRPSFTPIQNNKDTFIFVSLFILLDNKGAFPMVSLKFFIDIILPAALWPWGPTQPLTEMSSRNMSWG